MKLIQLIKRDKARIEQTRTIAKIHISGAAYHSLLKDPPLGDYNAEHNTLLGCPLVIHTGQVAAYWFEDVNGQRVEASGAYL